MRSGTAGCWAAWPSSPRWRWWARGCCGRPSSGCRWLWRPDAAEAPAESLDRDATSMERAAVAALVLLVAGTVLMLAQP